MSAFAGQTILITGASSGIGEAFVRHLIPLDATLILTARSEEKLNQLAETARASGTEAHVYPLDLGQPGAAQTLFDQTTADGHGVDVLLNNAGFGLTGRLESLEAAELTNMTQLNVTAVTELARLYGESMLARGRGGILNVASTAAFMPIPYFAVYAATKHYVKAFSEALHEEWKGRGVTVTCLCPGATKTGFGDRADMKASFFENGETPEKVARVGLEALARGERTVISGAANAAMANVARLLPSGVSAKLAAQMFAPGDEAS